MKEKKILNNHVAVKLTRETGRRATKTTQCN